MFSMTGTGSTSMAAARATCVVLVAALGMGHVMAGPASVRASSQELSPNGPHQSTASFEAAIRDKSTSPVYVLITVVDDRTGTASTGCTTGNLLLGAIHLEYGLEYDPASVANARNIALADPDHVFHFSKPEALANVAVRYSAQDLEAARQVIRPLTEQQLRERFAQRGDLQISADAVRDARACALVERGLSVRMADRTGKLLLDR